LAGRATPIVWECQRGVFHATILDPDGAPRSHLVVNSNGIWWEWTVLRPGAEWTSAVEHGRTVTRHGAMWDAERVALLDC
jgi:hypothetical protein